MVIAYNVSMGISGKDIVKRMSQMHPLKCYTQDLGIPIQTISNWKLRDAPPRADDLLKIAKYLNVSIEWLLTGEDENIPQDVLNLAYEIKALPPPFQKIIKSTLETLKETASEKEKEEQLNIG